MADFTDFTNIGVAAVILLLLLDRLPTFVSRIRGPVPVHTNGKAGEISVAAWELKFKTMFEECLDKVVDKMNTQHGENMRALDRIERMLEK